MFEDSLSLKALPNIEFRLGNNTNTCTMFNMTVIDDYATDIHLSPDEVLAVAADLDRRAALFALAVRR